MLGVELLGMLLAIVGLFGKNDVYYFGADQMQILAGAYSQERGYWIDESFGVSGEVAKLTELSLPAGVYRISMQYETDTIMQNMCTVLNNEVRYHTLLSNGEHLYAGAWETDFAMWLLKSTDCMEVHVEYGGVGSIAVQGITITQTNALNRILLFLWIALSLSVNAGYVYWQYDGVYHIPVRNKLVTLALGAIMLVSSIPLFVDYMLPSGDLVYHLMRIEGVKDGILAGQFPVRIAPKWQQGYGYASSIFYGETVLYLAALFRMLGFTVVSSYRLFFAVVNIGMVLIGYGCFRKMFQDRFAAVMSTAVYALSIYRVFKLYGNGAFGECIAMLFLPFIAYGFYRVFALDVKAPEYRKSWIPLTIGFAGLVQSHLLTGELVGGFTILLCVLMWKKVFRKETFLVLAKTVIYSCLVSAWFLVPFVDYMVTGNFVIQNVSARTIQERGLYIPQLLKVFVANGKTVFTGTDGMEDAQAAGVGMAMLLSLVIWLTLCFLRKTEYVEKRERRLAGITSLFAILAMCMSLLAFPWDRIQFLNKITATLVSSIQMPNRFLTIAAISLAVVTGVVAKWFGRAYGERGKMIFAAVISLLLVLGSVYLMEDMLNRSAPTRVYNAEGMGTGYIAGAEYLPYGADASRYMPREPLAEENITVEGYEKNGLTVDTTCFNDSDREGALEMPLLYYKGYRAYDINSGERLEVYDGTNHVVGVAVPAGYTGTIRVTFTSPWYWRVAEVVNLLAVIVLCIAGSRRKGMAV